MNTMYLSSQHANKTLTLTVCVTRLSAVLDCLSFFLLLFSSLLECQDVAEILEAQGKMKSGYSI